MVKCMGGDRYDGKNVIYKIVDWPPDAPAVDQRFPA